MAFRFLRRVRVAPGVRLNLSKRGAGLSFGPRGATVSVGRTGVHRHLGIPGTGISHRQKLASVGGSKTRTKGPTSSSSAGAYTFRLLIDESGDVSLASEDNAPLSDQEIAIIRKYEGDRIGNVLNGVCDDRNAEVQELEQVHLSSPPPLDKPVFNTPVFDREKPNPWPEKSIMLLERIWPPARKRLEIDNEKRRESYRRAMTEWDQDRQQFLREVEKQRERYMTGVLTDVEVMQEVLEEQLTAILWPRPTNIDFDFGNNAATLAIDIDLPEEDDFPAYAWSVPGRQMKLTRKNLTATRRREIYQAYVHGAAMRVAGEVFHRLPTVQLVMISGYSQRADRATGQDQDTYLYSVIVDKPAWREINFASLAEVHPAEALGRFEIRRSMSKTGIFKGIQPFTMEDLEKRWQEAGQRV